MLDIDKLRAETPGADGVVHFNNAGASLMPAPVRDTVLDYIAREAEIGGYEAAAEHWDRLEGVYDSLARLLNARREEIAVVENATRAWDMAFYSLPLGRGDKVLTAEAEYASNYIAYLQVARRTGAEIVPIPNDEAGQLDTGALARAIDDRVKLISVTHIPTNGGLVNPAAEIGRIAREAGVPYLLDACQSAGQMPLDVGAIGCDMLTATSRKFLRGPRGVGFLYVRKEMIEKLEPPFLDLHAATWAAPDRIEIREDARRFETWECNWAGKVGLGVAVDYALALGLEPIWQHIETLAAALRDGLDAIPGAAVRDLGDVRCGIVSFTIDGWDNSALKQALSDKGINIAVSPGNFTLLDMTARGLSDLARASVHYYNTEAEVAQFCGAVEDLSKRGQT